MSESLQIVHQIVSSPPDHSIGAGWIAAISAGIGMLGGVLGTTLAGIFQARAAKKVAESAESQAKAKLQAEIIATERLRWLQDLRARLANFYVQLDLQFNMLQRPTGMCTQQDLDDLSRKVMLEGNLIILLMNPTKPEQNLLALRVNSAMALVQMCFPPRSVTTWDKATYSGIKDDAFVCLIKIGVETWKQVKELK